MHSPGVGAAGIKRGVYDRPPIIVTAGWGHRRRPGGLAAYRRKALAGHSHRNEIQPTRLTSMDRVYLAIIVSALLLLGATGLYLTRTADLMPHARLVGAAR
jgi:hypothetical protein